MNKFKIALASVLCMSIFQTAPVSFARQITETTPVPRPADWWMATHNQNVQTVQNNVIDIAFFGDSITEFMNKQLLHKYFGEQSANIGIKGDCTEHLLWRLQNGELDFKKQMPKIAIVLIGTNNLFHSQNEEIFEGIKADVLEIRTKLPLTPVLVVGILPRGETASDKARGRIIKINKMTAALADNQNIFYTDIDKSLLQPDLSISRSVMDDFLHPTKEVGYTKMYEALKPDIEKILNRKH